MPPVDAHSGRCGFAPAAASRSHAAPEWAGRNTSAYSPTLYIDGLIGEHTITTVPDATLDAFRDSPDPAPDRFTMLDDIDRARADLAALAEAGVDLDAITSDLERAGVEQFAAAYAQMLEAIARKRERIAVR